MNARKIRAQKNKVVTICSHLVISEIAPDDLNAFYNAIKRQINFINGINSV